jgi:hypothetical protein
MRASMNVWQDYSRVCSVDDVLAAIDEVSCHRLQQLHLISLRWSAVQRSARAVSIVSERSRCDACWAGDQLQHVLYARFTTNTRLEPQHVPERIDKVSPRKSEFAFCTSSCAVDRSGRGEAAHDQHVHAFEHTQLHTRAADVMWARACQRAVQPKRFPSTHFHLPPVNTCEGKRGVLAMSHCLTHNGKRRTAGKATLTTNFFGPEKQQNIPSLPHLRPRGTARGLLSIRRTRLACWHRAAVAPRPPPCPLRSNVATTLTDSLSGAHGSVRQSVY